MINHRRRIFYTEVIDGLYELCKSHLELLSATSNDHASIDALNYSE